jgi:hypothetical protein
MRDLRLWLSHNYGHVLATALFFAMFALYHRERDETYVYFHMIRPAQVERLVRRAGFTDEGDESFDRLEGRAPDPVDLSGILERLPEGALRLPRRLYEPE